MPDHGVLTFLSFIGSGLLWVGALRVYANLLYSVRRSQIISMSTGATALLVVGRALADMRAAHTNHAVLLLLSGISFGGAAVTFALAARKKRHSTETPLPQF